MLWLPTVCIDGCLDDLDNVITELQLKQQNNKSVSKVIDKRTVYFGTLGQSKY